MGGRNLYARRTYLSPTECGPNPDKPIRRTSSESGTVYSSSFLMVSNSQTRRERSELDHTHLANSLARTVPLDLL